MISIEQSSPPLLKARHNRVRFRVAQEDRLDAVKTNKGNLPSVTFCLSLLRITFAYRPRWLREYPILFAFRRSERLNCTHIELGEGIWRRIIAIGSRLARAASATEPKVGARSDLCEPTNKNRHIDSRCRPPYSRAEPRLLKPRAQSRNLGKQHTETVVNSGQETLGGVGAWVELQRGPTDTAAEAPRVPPTQAPIYKLQVVKVVRQAKILGDEAFTMQLCKKPPKDACRVRARQTAIENGRTEPERGMA